ncbi:MAG: SAM-dependent chlorinase/fluorinase [Bacteroidales bacterium]|nr:SAM-dependent chlorinase/fluorinase [Bacteroidales bacterium]MDD3330498.1 SAM-dependent chlorinase/fluorinase [Bacteroidales bacterium]MDD3691608.1 SAM-dependent chlorinase/fluorinase [Bacteroidales bacterium]MDD4045027.1 SAM-dependent chlorinase/fluorinase [Bacteroidales bacterium]MDD4582078.1 SAM-dependent chlorinase/fluorinase [Bacteroidales bacterium]
MNHIITLTSDWGVADNSLAIFKAHIFKALHDACLLDISHQIMPFNVEMGAYLLASSYPFFPEGSIHMFDVDFHNTLQEQSYVRCKQKQKNVDVFFTDYLAVKYKGHYFLAKNNGFFSLLCDDINDIEEVVKLSKKTDDSRLKNFKAIAYFIHPLITLAQKHIPLTQLGEFYDKKCIELIKPRNPLIKKNNDSEEIVEFGVKYVDNYGNIVTDLHKSLFDRVAKGRKNLQIHIKGIGNYKLTLVDSYDDVARNDKLVLTFNHASYLEIASKYGRLAMVLDITDPKIYDCRFRLTFKDTNT